MTEYGDQYYERQIESYRNKHPAQWRRINIFMEWLQPKSGELVLETGSGQGIGTRELSRSDAKVIALDYESLAHRIACRFLKEEGVDLDRIFHVRGDLYNLSFSDNTFDAINFSEVIEHLETPDKALSELFRVLKPGGRLFLSTWPNLANLVWKYRYARGAGSKEDFNPHTPSRVKNSLARTNFRITRFRLSNFYFTIPKIPWEISAINQDNPFTRLLEKSLGIPVWGAIMAESINALAVKP